MAQMDFPFFCNDAKLKEFLVALTAIENEEDKLREEKRLLKEGYQDHFPMRGVITAVKVVRATRKLETHPKEPMSRVHLKMLEHAVEAHLPEMENEPDVPTVVSGRTAGKTSKRLGFALVADKEQQGNVVHQRDSALSR